METKKMIYHHLAQYRENVIKDDIQTITGRRFRIRYLENVTNYRMY